jgi:chaperonin cofactor prefoldin
MVLLLQQKECELILLEIVGIGTSSPNGKLTISNSGAGGFEFTPDTTAFSVANSNYIASYDRSASAYRDIVFDLGGAESQSVRFKAGGNVGIGTTSPSSKLHVYGGAILVDNGSSAGTIYFHDTTNYINLSSDALQFANNGAERMRIDSSGEIHVNKTSTVNNGQFEVLAQANHQAIVAKVQTNAYSVFQGFNASGSAVFTATGAGALTITGTLSQGSDISLKENIKPLDNQLETVKKLNPVTFDWKEDKKPYQQIGFIAQEVEKHLPELTEDKDDIKRMSYGNMTAVLVKAIQEQQTQIEALQSEINTLKGGD